MPFVDDLTEQTFGKWTVLGRSQNWPNARRVYWSCQCSCTQVADVAEEALTQGWSTQCRSCRESASG